MQVSSSLKLRPINWRYRIDGETYDGIDLPVIPYIKPRSLNWRYRLGDKAYDDISDLPVIPYIQPRALNWRYQVTPDQSADLN
jgi:hypothetical protein